MGPYDDDLAEFADDPVLRALTGPATADELAGEGEALAAFRAAVPRRSRRRYIGRLGVGGSALGIAVALSGGVAAAYSSSLPQPLQHFAHDIGGWAAVPPSHRVHHANASGHSKALAGATPSATPTTGTGGAGPAPTASPRPAGSSSGGAHQLTSGKKKLNPQPSPSLSPTAPVGTPSPSITPTPTPSGTPTPTPSSTVPVAGSITITLSAGKVAVGNSVSVTGHLATETGEPVPNQRIWLVERSAGGSTDRVASGRTDLNGSVYFATSALGQSVSLRLGTTGGLRSATQRVVVVPSISTAVSAGATSDSVTVSVAGGDPGDTLQLDKRAGGSWTAVTTTQLDGSSDATFSVPAGGKRAAHYRLVLPRTRGHGFASVRFTIPAGQ